MKDPHPVLVLALLLSSCSTVAPPPATVPAVPATATLSASTPTTAPTVAIATPLPVLSIETIDYDLPDQLAGRIEIENLPELVSPVTDEPVPKHITLTLVKYPVDSQYSAQVDIFLWKDSLRFQEPRRLALENAIDGKASPQAYLDSIDLFAAEDLKARPQKLDFQNGSGVSYLYYWGVGPGVPVSNDRLIYTFDGLTDDKKYFVQVSFPVAVPFLDDTIDLSQPVGSAPPGVVPYPEPGDMDAAAAYYDILHSQLNGSDVGVFSPALDILDAFIRSLLLVIKE